MPAIDFPTAPAVNDEYTFEGRTWLWNGTGWEVKAFVAPVGATGATGVQGATGVIGASGATGVAGPSDVISASDITTNATYYPVFVAGTGNQTPSIRTTATAFSFNPSSGNLIINGDFGAAITPTANVHIAAGTATANTAPLKIEAGTNLTAIEADSFEYDGKLLFHTANDTTNDHGRALIPEVQTVIRTSNLNINDTTSPGTSLFGATTRPALLAGYTYLIDINIFVTKVTTGGTLTIQASASTGNFTYVSLARLASAVDFVDSGTTSPVTVFTTSLLTAGTSYNNTIRGIIRPASNCRLDLLGFSSTATFTILSTSYFTVTNIGTANIGNIA